MNLTYVSIQFKCMKRVADQAKLKVKRELK